MLGNVIVNDTVKVCTKISSANYLSMLLAGKKADWFLLPEQGGRLHRP